MKPSFKLIFAVGIIAITLSALGHFYSQTGELSSYNLTKKV
jgi:hypothetical protein